MRGAALLLIVTAAAAQDRTISSDANIRSVSFSKDGSTLAGLGSDRKLRQWDVRSGAARNTIEWAADERPVGMNPASGLFALFGKDGVALTDLPTGTVKRKISVGDRRLGQIAIAADGQAIAGSSRVAGISREEIMRLWDATGQEKFATSAGIGGTSSLAISPDGAILAAGSYDTNIRLWSTRNGELVRLIEDVPVAIFGLAFTPDGKTLAAAGVDRTVYFWETKTWKLERKLTGQPEMISALGFSGDGRLLATGGFNDITRKHPVSIFIWDVASGKILHRLPAPQRVSSVALSPDGKLLAAAADEKTVRLWTVR